MCTMISENEHNVKHGTVAVATGPLLPIH